MPPWVFSLGGFSFSLRLLPAILVAVGESPGMWLSISSWCGGVIYALKHRDSVYQAVGSQREEWRFLSCNFKFGDI